MGDCANGGLFVGTGTEKPRRPFCANRVVGLGENKCLENVLVELELGGEQGRFRRPFLARAVLVFGGLFPAQNPKKIRDDHFVELEKLSVLHYIHLTFCRVGPELGSTQAVIY